MKHLRKINYAIAECEKVKDEKYSHIEGWTTKILLWEDDTFQVTVGHGHYDAGKYIGIHCRPHENKIVVEESKRNFKTINL